MGFLDDLLGTKKPKKKRAPKEELPLTIELIMTKYVSLDVMKKLSKQRGLRTNQPKSQLIKNLIDSDNIDNNEILNSMKLDNLKRLCGHLKLQKSGIKEDLVRRIMPHIIESGTQKKQAFEERETTQSKPIEEPKPHYEKKEIIGGLNNPTFEDVLTAIYNWKPVKKHVREEGYTVDLESYLRLIMKFNTQFEAGTSNADILVGQNIAIELKKSPSQAEYDRLTGQVKRQKREFGFVIVVICNPKNRDKFEEFKSDCEENNIRVFSI